MTSRTRAPLAATVALLLAAPATGLTVSAVQAAPVPAVVILSDGTPVLQQDLQTRTVEATPEIKKPRKKLKDPKKPKDGEIVAAGENEVGPVRVELNWAY